MYPPYFLTFTNMVGLEVSDLTFLNPPMITVQTCSCDIVHMHHLNITAGWLTPTEFYSHSANFSRWRAIAPVTAGGVGKNGSCGGGRQTPGWSNEVLCEPRKPVRTGRLRPKVMWSD